MSGPLTRVRQAVAAAQALGPRWMLYRAGHALSLRSGWMERRHPAFAWDEAPLGGLLSDSSLAAPAGYLEYRRAAAPRFFFAPADRAGFAPLLAEWDRDTESPLVEAEAARAGRFRYFSNAWADLGANPDWHRNPFTGQSAPARHWSRIDDFGAGDIKVIWEPSRFGWAFALVRAYWRTSDELHAETFWRLFESWRAANPPLTGPNWKCGQETSLRVMAWCFALHGFLDSPASTPERVTALAQAIAVSGRRIEHNVAYALSQRNNHGISEGMGLFTCGTLFPELADAARWRERGRGILARLARDLIYDDGAFSQHSANYHRLMLQLYAWSLRLAELAGQPFDAATVARVGAAAEFIARLQDTCTGAVPLYGANDGALALPLSNSPYHDFRPVVQAAWLATRGARAEGPGPWDEASLWLLGRDALAAPLQPPRREDEPAREGGCAVLRAPPGEGFAMMRCARYRHRPGQADQLHVDVWWKGINVALDAGTYGYNASEPWSAAFEGTAMHNTVLVDGRDQMDKVSRFLWFPWSSAAGEPVGLPRRGFSAEQDGYRRLAPPVTHRRTLTVTEPDGWIVADELESAGEHEYRLHWLLPDLPYEWDAATHSLVLRTRHGAYAVRVAAQGATPTASLVRADAARERGWRAAFYASREPALSLAVTVRAARATFCTTMGPA